MGFFDLFRRGKADKKAVIAQGGYEAAAYSRDRSTIFTAAPDDSANPPAYTRNEILRISRYLADNHPLTNRILTVAETYGVGAGLVANAATADQDFNAAASEAFENWANNAFASSTQNYSFYEMQKIVARELLLAGEIFLILEKSDSGYPQLRLVSSESVRHSGKKTDNSIEGIYYDTFGTAYAYNIATANGVQRVDASNVVHIVRHKRVNQRRGIGSFAASLNSARDHKDCVLLEKKAVKVHSTLAAFVEKEGGEAAGGIMGDMTDLPSSSDSAVANVGLERAFAGAVIYGNKGEKVNLLSSDRSTSGFLSFLELLHREVCLDISLPYEFVVNAEKLNGTAVRFALSDAGCFFRDIQDRMIDGGLQRIYAWVIASFIKQGKLAMPATGMPWAVSWTRPVSVNVDATRVSNTEISLLQNGLLTFESYYSARGKDWKHEIKQRVAEEVFLDELSKETGVPISRLRSLAAGSAPVPDSADATDPTQKAA